ncbi:hypothetical protein JW851_00310 [Candidatus Woesearchaeota archaeon]|nr:hypothetical protein [Candidatus Woesearchaeota archaeon]
MKTKKTIAIMMMVLIVMMPIVYSEPSETFELFATVPTATKDNTVTITGTTKANIDVVVSVNKARVAEIISDSNGEFSTSPITLVQENNDITIKATDSQGNIRTLTYNIKLDNSPPKVTYINIPTGSQTRTITITGTTNEPVTIDWKTSNLTIYKSVQAKDTFNFNIDLEDGLNKLELIAKDSAGNQDKQEFEIMHDVVAPSFLLTNLDGLDNCYLDFPAIKGKKVDITGQLNEKATIFVYVNHESNPSKVRTTDETGYFRIKDVLLEGTLKIKTSPTQTTIETGNQYENHIRLVAKDLAGNEAQIEKTITCETCGGGAAGYSLNTASALQAMTPTELLPSLLITGIETITIPFNLSYVGLNEAAIRSIQVTPVIMGPEYEKDYDNDKITASVLPLYSRDKQTATGIIQIKINKFDPLGSSEKDATHYRREYNVSRHRYGKCAFQPELGKDLDYGCMRFFLMMEVQYQETTEQTYLDPNVQQTGLKRENKIQKICFSNIEVSIAKVTEQYIPKKMVKKWIKNIDHILKKAEPVKEYLDTATEYATYTCLASAGTLALARLAELTTCQISEWIASIGEASWHSEIAEAGICELVYHEDFDKKGSEKGIKGNERARNSCIACSEMIGLRKWIEYEVMHRACDRVGCPAAKTFKSYIQDKAGKINDITPYIKTHFDKAKAQGKETESKMQTILTEHGAPMTQQTNVANKRVFVGNDCGFTTTPKYISTTYSDISGKGIKTLYEYTKAQGPREYCTKYLRAAQPECCGINYAREWSTACGIGQVSGENVFLLDTFDELKESTCYAARQAGDPSAAGTGIDCSGGMLWNAMAGFCEPNTGAAVDEVIHTGMNYEPRKQDSEDNRVYVFVTPEINAKKETEDYKIYRGYAVNKLKYEANKEEHKDAKRLTQSLYKVYDSENLAHIFKNEKTSDKQKQAELKTALCEKNKKQDVEKCENIERTYNRIKEIIGSEDNKEYIVRADTGLLRSIQCICFPAVKAWVDQWLKILTMLRNCLATVEIGKGDAGVCDDFLSQVVCDRIYELLKCFSSKIGWSGAGKRITGDFGIGSIIGILTNTASEMSKTMESRYGETSMWTALFNERDLVHGVCMWAFTGKYDLQIEQIVQHTTEEIAIESQPFIGECKRYFRGYSPTTVPTGLTTWAYECGMAMVAGANITYQIKLQCSNDFRCSEKDGFRNNECDCVGKDRPQIHIAERGPMNKGDMFNKKFTWPIQAGQSGSKYRYDTAILYYEWIDPKTNEKRSNQATRYIGQAGAEPFGFCAFDPVTVAFRCQFGKQEGSIKIKDIDPDYKDSEHPTKKTKVFFMDQPFTFEAKIKQKMPDDPAEQQEAKKFLYYKIINHAGSTVKEIKPEEDTAVWVFESNGDYTEEIEIELPEDDIKKYLDQTPGEIAMAQIETDGTTKTAEPTDYISSYTVFKREKKEKGKEEIKSISAIIEMTSEEIAIYNTRSKTASTFYKGDIMLAKQPNEEGELHVPSEVNQYQIKVTIEKLPEPGQTVRIYVPAQTSLVPTPLKTKDPADWRAIFTLYDANKYGETTDQVTISPDGQKQIKEVTFKVAGMTEEEGGKFVAEEKKEISKPTPSKYMLIQPPYKFYSEDSGKTWTVYKTQPDLTVDVVDKDLDIQKVETKYDVTEKELLIPMVNVEIISPQKSIIGLRLPIINTGLKVTFEAEATGGTGTGYTYEWLISGKTYTGNKFSIDYSTKDDFKEGQGEQAHIIATDSAGNGNTETITFYPRTRNSHVILLNDGTSFLEQDKLDFEYIDNEWQLLTQSWRMEEAYSGGIDPWWNKIFEEMRKVKNDYSQGVEVLVKATNKEWGTRRGIDPYLVVMRSKYQELTHKCCDIDAEEVKQQAREN